MWLSGPLVNEWRVQSLVNDNLLRITFDIRAYADGTTHTDMIYGNDWFFQGGKSEVDYRASISQNGSHVFTRHKEVNTSQLPTPNVQYDVRYLIDTGHPELRPLCRC